MLDTSMSPSSEFPQPVFFLQKVIRNAFGPLIQNIKVNQPKTAHRICHLIPAYCPFERDVILFGQKLFHIPALCKINPVYEELMELRFRALSFLADECGEDVTPYCQ
jgi:hypothetical protein